MDGGEDYRFAATKGWSGGMRKSKNKEEKSYVDIMKEAAEKYGVKVTDMSKRGIRAIGFLGGVGSRDQGPDKPNSPVDPGRPVPQVKS
jgi:hypothetical protein